MSAPKHTPGPWWWEDDAMYGGAVQGVTPIIETDSGVYGPHGADRSLIAAAPDLLIACKMALDSIERSDGARCLDDQQALYALRCAILKAEGGTS